MLLLCDERSIKFVKLFIWWNGNFWGLPKRKPSLKTSEVRITLHTRMSLFIFLSENLWKHGVILWMVVMGESISRHGGTISVNLIKERQYTHQIWPASSVKERWGENTLYARGQAVHWGQARARSRWQRPLNKAYHPPASHRRLVILTYRKLV